MVLKKIPFFFNSFFLDKGCKEKPFEETSYRVSLQPQTGPESSIDASVDLHSSKFLILFLRIRNNCGEKRHIKHHHLQITFIKM